MTHDLKQSMLVTLSTTILQTAQPNQKRHSPPMSNLTTGPSDPHASAETKFGMGVSTTRRLCVITYECELCGDHHSAEYYFTFAVPDLPAFEAALRETIPSRIAALPAVRIHSTSYHEDRGDLQALSERAAANGLYRVSDEITTRITGEADYTCDLCNGTFPTIADLRLHRGLDPHTSRAAAPTQCPSEMAAPGNGK